MPSERVQRQINRLLDEAEEALVQRDWSKVRDLSTDALALDPDNEDAQTFLAAAGRSLAMTETIHPEEPTPPPQEQAQSTSFSEGRYQIEKFLGEGGKKQVYLARDSLLDREVAFALIKTEGLDDISRTRIAREAQAMGSCQKPGDGPVDLAYCPPQNGGRRNVRRCCLDDVSDYEIS